MDNDKKFYIVYGLGESTGCRLLTKILLDFGCYGRSGHDQDFDSFILNDNKLTNYFKNLKDKMPVIRFSYPHGNKIIDLYRIYTLIKRSGFDNIYILFTTRSLPATIISTDINHCVHNQMTEELHKNPHLRAKLAHMNCFHWIHNIFNNLDKNIIYRFTILNLLDLSEDTELHLRFICKELDLKYPENYDYSFIWKNVNDKDLKLYEDKYL